MLASAFLFAQEAVQDATPKVSTDPMGPLGGMLPFILILGAFFLLVVLPSSRREKKQRESLLANLKKNDEVLTSSGIIGTVQNLREGEDEVTIKIDDNCKVRMKKSNIVQILKAKEADPAPAK